MRRTRRSPARGVAGRRPEDERAGRGVARRSAAASSRLALREQIGQVASRRLWRQNVGTAVSGYLWQARALRLLTTAYPGRAVASGLIRPASNDAFSGSDAGLNW